MAAAGVAIPVQWLDGPSNVPAVRLAMGIPSVAWRLLSEATTTARAPSSQPNDMLRFMRANSCRSVASGAPCVAHSAGKGSAGKAGAAASRHPAGVGSAVHGAPPFWRHALAASVSGAALAASARAPGVVLALPTGALPAVRPPSADLDVPAPPPALPCTDMSQLPRVDDLIRTHRSRIDAVRAHPSLEGMLDADEHDDLFLLRYVLTYERSAGAAARAIRTGLDWRMAHAELFTRIDAVQRDAREISPLGLLPWRNLRGEPVQIAVPCAADTAALVAKPDEWHIEAGVSNREAAFRLTDRLTRESGRLVRLVVVQDLAGLSLPFAMSNRRLGPVQGHLSKLQDVLYPQLMHAVVVVHPPPFADVLYSMGRTLLSERLMAKISIASSSDAFCVAAALPRSHVPRFLGGDHPWRPEWLPAALAVAGTSASTE
mmetsp:Transcript_20883/g.53868  ORF Transcript_20883/g.53868 Transcript_20883/m.53868 type:complete len:431 (+) Transcript_20883:30-1322(+)